MERKRKLPARAAARIEQAAKKGRTSTPEGHRSATPASAVNGTPVPDDQVEPQQHQQQQPAPPPPLPTSIQPGKPLPTVEDAQPDELATRDYQSFQESGVLAESLTRSRQRWISEGLFEKYWSKPTKKKGVVHEDPKNPPKESMAKIGQVTISIEPHVLEATMYAVKDPNKSASQQPVFRPILQYGPPGGAMPPPPSPLAKPPTPLATFTRPLPQPPMAASAPAVTSSPSSAAAPPLPPQQSSSHTHTTWAASQPPPPSPATAPRNGPAIASATASIPQHPIASPRGMESATTSPASAMRSANVPPSTASQIPQPSPSPAAPAVGPSYAPPGPPRSPALLAPAPTPPQVVPRAAPPPPPATQSAPTAPGADPIIVTLAEKANEDPHLRDLMKRVANGNAPKDELARFQAIIDQITAESKKKGATQGPAAERLFVEGRTVRYYADEVDTILTIVLRTNPKQTSAHLSVPPNSNPLVVELVKAALDDTITLDRVRRIAKNTPEGSDTTDLKETLERLRIQLEQRPASSVGSSKGIGTPNGQSGPTAQPSHAPAPQQALRSKGPPPAIKPDVSALVFEFAGGNGDRCLFPKFSIVEQVQTPSGPQVIASFLIVRKGSASDYGCDPSLDYYQPITVRISSTQPKNLEYFSRVVVPQDEVRRYMEDIMDNMTRAEYVLLAMKLPKPDKEPKEDVQGPEKEKENKVVVDSQNATPEADASGSEIYRKGLTWKKDKTMRLLAKPTPLQNVGKLVDDQESYQSFIASVSRKAPHSEE